MLYHEAVIIIRIAFQDLYYQLCTAYVAYNMYICYEIRYWGIRLSTVHKWAS